MTITRTQFEAVGASLSGAAERFATLVETTDPAAETVPGWSVADLAAHVTAIARMYTVMLDPAASSDRDVSAITVFSLHDLNELMLVEFSERDPRRLAGLLREHVGEMLRLSGELDPELLVPWLGGSRLPVGGALAHLLNELLIHGRDIALAAGADWDIPPADAAWFFELFLYGMIRGGVSGLLDGTPGSARRIAVEFHSAHTTSKTVVLQGHQVSLEEPDGRADVRVSFDPAVLALVMFGRYGKARAVLTGKLVVRGPRPWLLPRFLRTVRVP
ncbi:maleylpyruvate isomerase family mycothiol-dependent enzyme [Amycolatopsis sp. H20-H5]|uniref:maleylpyruvate isomerase family mycothiol-dependent enzyme n=1 Tax=Amycolatopsis sp. H20-H5 TaxID=3046309 RepID=UPI002DBF6763|nr:maleylpyruvate isomerase family mycothiol-dependent enzyme [Amycolatopsis sp. H20-H5]MEC3981790.1 maleylpyruvate isomerase family mycothiol-dependent enzyme [Amycolatopsis sp. H20-H5]